MRAIFAADDSPHVEIGTVYPTDDIRGTLYVDPMLSKHFAILGSTGTGKSTSVALILHRISQLSPEGHIVMIDPHGEYSAAFKSCGELFNVDNLQLPYWLLNFEEHCEVLLTTDGAERQRDADILAKCLLAARTKGKNRRAIRQGDGRFADPLPADRSQPDPGRRNGQARPRRRHHALPAAQEQARRAPRRPALHLHVLGHAGVGFDGQLHRQAVPPAEPRPADLDRRRVGRSVRSHLASSSRCWRAWCSTMRSGRGPRRSARCCWSAKRPTATSPRTSMRAARRFARSSSGSPRKAVNMACRWASSRSARPTLPKACCRSAARSSRCVSTTTATRPASAPRCPKARAASSTPSRRLRNRECIVCGEGVAIPIRVRFDDLEPEKRPASSDPSFAACWRETGDEEGIIQRTIKRWRGHGR